MNGRRLILAVAVALAAASTGCHLSKHHSRGGTIEPLGGVGCEGPCGEGDGVMVTRTHLVDRHPLLYKPRDVYHATGHHKIVKAMAATVVGVPAGVVCEVGQIFYGCERCVP